MQVIRRVFAPLAVVAAFVIGGLALSALTAGSLTAVRSPGASFDAFLTFAGSAVAWLVYGYLVLSALITLLAALPGAAGSAFDTVAAHVTPEAYRRMAQVALGLSVMAGPVVGTAAHAAPMDVSSISTGARGALPVRGVERIDLDRPATAPTDAGRIDLDRPGTTTIADPLVRPTREINEAYTVVRGDSLWEIARAHLPADADDDQIEAEWHSWYAANRHRVGANPDVIHPGQVFIPPAH